MFLIEFYEMDVLICFISRLLVIQDQVSGRVEQVRTKICNLCFLSLSSFIHFFCEHWISLLLHIDIQSTLFKTETFGAGTMCHQLVFENVLLIER